MRSEKPGTLRKIAAIQMCSTADVASNLAVAQHLIHKAVRDGAKLVVLPENFALLGVEKVYQAGVMEAENTQPTTIRKCPW